MAPRLEKRSLAEDREPPLWITTGFLPVGPGGGWIKARCAGVLARPVTTAYPI